MNNATEFIDAVTSLALGGRRPNENQCACIQHPVSPDLMIIAGPGSGKTTVLVLRALKHVIVDSVLPEDIVITTFTKKAAAEIRSRLISWGIPLFQRFTEMAKSRGDLELERHVGLCDVNAFATGTLDSLCEQWTGRMRKPGEIPAVMLEDFAARQVFSRSVFGPVYQNPSNKGKLDAYLGEYTWEQVPPSTQGEAVEVAKLIIDRLVQDLVDVQEYSRAPGSHLDARALIAEAFGDLHELMRLRGQYDFALLEAEFLRKLRDPSLRQKIRLPRVILVDEYQDTNPLQEAIYFELARVAQSAVTIVGDDDQALYRFRGATVELFRDFCDRFSRQVDRPPPNPRFLVENYRSTTEIVGFCNGFIANDPEFTAGRIIPPKPAIIAAGSNSSKRVPILGMFRASPADLASDLARFLEDVFRNGGYLLPDGETRLSGWPDGGNFADCVFLAHSVNEFGRSVFGQPGKPRLPWMLRQELQARGVPVFNPRGRALKDIPDVRKLLGLICLCIDPSKTLLDNLKTYGAAKREMAAWRTDAEVFVGQNPAPKTPHSLAAFVRAWQVERPQATGMADWPREWPLLDLVYKLLAWLPDFQNFPECQVYLEAITRSVTQATTFSPYQGRLLRDSPHHDRSRESVLRDILAPVAEDLMAVDEELLTHLPRNHFNMMTIHQSKGLEFPLVIVDVGAEFSMNSPKQRFKRFPDRASNVAEIESDLAPFTPVGALRTRRTVLNRTFEDLIRLYYVAYSRPQTALLLVGHTKLLAYNTTIRSIATFWQQGGHWPWQAATPVLAARPPASVSGFGVTEV